MLKRKVYAYIVHAGKLLVFRQRDFPKAGIQIPGGTMFPGENPKAAVLREATKETGLEGLRVLSLVGEEVRNMSDWGLKEVHVRYFFRLSCPKNPPETWTHFEGDSSDGSPAPIALEFFWAELPDAVPPLTSEQDYYIGRLNSPNAE